MGGPLAKGHAIAGLVIGALEIVFALIIVICSFVLSGKAQLSGALTPYWAGIPFLIPGILGVVSGITKNFCAMVAFMVLNIITFIIEGVACLLIAIVVAVYAAYASGTCNPVGSGCYCRTSDGRTITLTGTDSCDVVKDISTMLYLLVVFLVLAAITALAGSIAGCAATCCGNKSTQPTVIVQQQVPMQAQPQPYYPPPGEVQYKQ